MHQQNPKSPKIIHWYIVNVPYRSKDLKASAPWVQHVPPKVQSELQWFPTLVQSGREGKTEPRISRQSLRCEHILCNVIGINKMCTFDVQHILQNAYFHEYFSFNHNLYVFIIYILCCIYIYIYMFSSYVMSLFPFLGPSDAAGSARRSRRARRSASDSCGPSNGSRTWRSDGARRLSLEATDAFILFI